MVLRISLTAAPTSAPGALRYGQQQLVRVVAESGKTKKLAIIAERGEGEPQLGHHPPSFFASKLSSAPLTNAGSSSSSETASLIILKGSNSLLDRGRGRAIVRRDGFGAAQFRTGVISQVRSFSSSRNSEKEKGSPPSKKTSYPPAPPPLNEVQVPLISPHLQSQLFPPPNSAWAPPPPSAVAIEISQTHLRSHGLLSSPPPPSKPSKSKLKSSQTQPETLSPKASKPPPSPAIDFVLPSLRGPTITHHFHSISSLTSSPYLTLSQTFSSASLAPLPPSSRWVLTPGWTQYFPDGSFESVPFPPEEDEVLVFDVETLPYQGGDFPVMAVAVGEKGWYGWCSPWLTGESESPRHLIPLGEKEEGEGEDGMTLFEKEGEKKRLIIGHNVLFDRARVGSEYSLRRPRTRWLDTLSLHVAVSGLTNPQRPSWMKFRKDRNLAEEKEREAEEEEEDSGVVVTKKKKLPSLDTAPKKDWKEVASLNSLVEVARLHLGTKVDKSLRNVFIDPLTTIADVRDNFSELMDYCAHDVEVTTRVFRVLLPKFLGTCPHPASFAGVLLMSQPVLPVDQKWSEYIERAEKIYKERLGEVKGALEVLAEEARAKMEKKGKKGRFEWQEDVWLRQLDWSPKKARRLPGVTPPKRKSKKELLLEEENGATRLGEPVAAVPFWFASLDRTHEGSQSTSLVPLSNPLAALLLQITYRSFPVVFTHSYGWLFAVPNRKKTFVPDELEMPVNSANLGPKDQLVLGLTGVKLFTIPGPGKGRCRSLFAPHVFKKLRDGIFASPYLEEVKIAMFDKASPVVARKLAQLVEETLVLPQSERDKDLWLRQLDWSPVVPTSTPSSPSSSTSSPTTSVNSADLMWPKWYKDLDVPGFGLDVSIGKRAAAVLLKLQWRGFPVVYSKQHGWTFRIPTDRVEEMLASDSALKPLSFTDVNDAGLEDDFKGIYVKLPHPDGEGHNVGSPLSKPFVSAFEDGVLSSEFPAAKAALELNASCSYWRSARERIMNQMVVWEGDAAVLPPTPASIAAATSSPTTRGLILPQVIPMGTVTRRSVERTWLTAANAKKNRVGSELKSLVRAPPGYAIVGADVDSEELWICSVMGDAQFGIHGATAIGWMTLEGTKSAGTDLHSKSASILGISRDDAKVFNYSRIYGAGVKHAVQLLLKANPTLTLEKATSLAKALYASTKGLTDRGTAFNRQFWHGGTESFVFNKLEEIAQSDLPRTPALGCGLTDALKKVYLPTAGRGTSDFMTSRVNWVVQSSGVDYLHLLLASMEYLTKRFGIDARYMISVHDEIRYLVKEEDKYRAAMALQISNLWTRALFSYRLQMGNLPQSCAFFSAVDVDHCFRKEVNMNCLTPSNPDPIPFGESLDISQSLATTSQGSLFRDGRSMAHDADLPDVPVPILSPDEVRGEQHRVEGTPFLLAQTKTSSADIREIWSHVKRGQRGTLSSASRSPSPPLPRQRKSSSDFNRSPVRSSASSRPASSSSSYNSPKSSTSSYSPSNLAQPDWSDIANAAGPPSPSRYQRPAAKKPSKPSSRPSLLPPPPRERTISLAEIQAYEDDAKVEIPFELEEEAHITHTRTPL